MDTSQSSAPGSSTTADHSAAGLLLAALEDAPSAVYCLAGPELAPIWCNARARSGDGEGRRLPVVAGRSVDELARHAVSSGRGAAIRGTLSEGELPVLLVVQPLSVDGAPGALLIIGADPESARVATPRSGAGSGLAAELVEQVQSSLLPPSLPLLPDVRLSGSYHRAGSASVAGGDWYDAFALGAGRVALVIGDAVGSGVAAAGAMSRLRGALRSIAMRDPWPGAVLAGLDDFAGQMGDVEGASVCYAVLESGTGRLTYAAAGHPAPLVVAAGGETAFLPLTARPPLGSLSGVRTEVSSTVLEPGGTLVMYSDGAIAASGPPPSWGLARLGEVTRSLLENPEALDGGGAAQLAAAVVAQLSAPEGPPDDIAVLVAHRLAETPAPLRISLLARPASMSAVRRRLGIWLDRLGVGESDRVGVIVAVGEAVANSAEHAYQDTDPGPVHISAAVDLAGVLTVVVRDEGTWRPADRDPGSRGRGLLIMRQLVDGVVLRDASGTTVTLSLRLTRTPEVVTDSRQTAGADVVVDRSGAQPVVRVTGEVDLLAAEQLRIRLLEASHGGTGRVELDLAAVTLFSSAAVRVVLVLARIARDEGWPFVVHAPRGGVTRHVLEISGLAGLVELR